MMDNWHLWDIMVRQTTAERTHWAYRKAACEMVAADAGKGRLRARLASLLARTAIRLDRETGRATLADAPNH